MALYYTNADGLVVRYGPGEGFASRIGEFMDVSNGEHVWDLHLKYTDFNSTTQTNFFTKTGPLDNARVPKGIYIERVEIFVKTAWAGASATLDLGLYRAIDDGATAIDADGLIAQLAVASLSVGAKITMVKGSTSAGALIGTVSDATYVGLFSGKANTAAWTAGEGIFRVVGRFINSATG